MAIRNDLSIDWSNSPRLITIAAPSTEITMQDLLDTLRQAEVDNMDEAQIVDAAGKENLGGGVQVGLTVTLLNALLGFEARSGPSWTPCKVSGGNLVATDENGDAFNMPLFPTAYVYPVLTQSSSATLSGMEDVEDGISFHEAMQAILAFAAGKTTGAQPGSTTIYIKNANLTGGTKNRIVATVDEYGNRSEIVFDFS